MAGKTPKTSVRFRRFPWHVMFLAVFPALFLYSNNLDELVAGHAAAPLAVSVASAALIYLVCFRFFKNPFTAGLAVSFFILLFFSYGRFYAALENRGGFLPGHALLLPATLLIWLLAVYCLGRTRRDLRNVTAILNIAAAALVLSSLVRISLHHFGRFRRAARPPVLWESDQIPPPGVPDPLPDIYFLVFDEYAHPETMRKYYDFDNSGFFAALREAGFCLAGDSRTPTPSTRRVLASILNMIQLAGEDRPDDFFYQLIHSDRVSDFLQGLGYQYVYLGNWFELSRYKRGMIERADYYFNYYQISPLSPVTEFQHVFWRTTMLRPFYYRLSGERYLNYHRQGFFKTLSRLNVMPSGIEGPKYVFAHIIPPHAPFVFGASGEVTDPEEILDYDYYLGQYIFITERIQELVEVLLEGTDPRPIIILQSDHGLRQGPDLTLADGEWKKILNAFYLPGRDCSEISDSILPADTFRLIFNLYFGMDYQLADD